MPIFDGLELTQMIRQPGANANPYVPIIMLTGHSEKKRVIAARDAGVTEFLAKPISAKALYQRIVNVVANPRPFIKTKTYFGPDRRRNVNPNYVGPGAAQGRQGRRDPPAASARQSQDRDRSESHRSIDSDGRKVKQSTKPPSVATYRRPRGDHAAEQAAQGGRAGAVPDDDDPVARAEAALAQLSTRILRLDGGGMRAARRRAPRRSSAEASPSRRTTRCSTPPTTSRAKPRRSAIPAVAGVADSLCRLIEHTPDIDAHPAGAGRPARRCGPRHRRANTRRAPTGADSSPTRADAGGCARSPTNSCGHENESPAAIIWKRHFRAVAGAWRRHAGD